MWVEGEGEWDGNVGIGHNNNIMLILDMLAARITVILLDVCYKITEFVSLIHRSLELKLCMMLGV